MGYKNLYSNLFRNRILGSESDLLARWYTVMDLPWCVGPDLGYHLTSSSRLWAAETFWDQQILYHLFYSKASRMSPRKLRELNESHRIASFAYVTGIVIIISWGNFPHSLTHSCLTISLHSGSHRQLQRDSTSELVVSIHHTPYRPPLRLARLRSLSTQQIYHRIVFHNMAFCPCGLHRCTYWCHRYPDWPYEVLRRRQDAVSRQAWLILSFPTRLPYIYSNFLGIDEEIIPGCEYQDRVQREVIGKAPSCFLEVHSAWRPGLFSVGHFYDWFFLLSKAFFPVQPSS